MSAMLAASQLQRDASGLALALVFVFVIGLTLYFDSRRRASPPKWDWDRPFRLLFGIVTCAVLAAFFMIRIIIDLAFILDLAG